MRNDVKVVDLTTSVGTGETVAIVYFEYLNGAVHIYRNGTVVLSSPAGTTVSSLHQPDDNELWRRTHFLQMLARLGATEQELATAEQMTIEKEDTLRDLGFSAAIKQVSEESIAHFQHWCQEQGLDYDAMDDADIDQLLETAIKQVRTR